MWVQHYLVGDANVYNMPQALRVSGVYDHVRFEYAVNHLVEINPTLRTIFIKNGNSTVQRVQLEAPKIDVKYFDYSQQSEESLLRFIDGVVYQAFDLTKLPLFKCFVCKLGENDHLIVFSIDHIVSDGWSLHLMFSEILKLSKTPQALKVAKNRKQHRDVPDMYCCSVFHPCYFCYSAWARQGNESSIWPKQ